VALQRKHRDNPSIKAEHLERLAWILDSAIRVPGTNYRIGIDGLIGLLPGFGDLVGALLSSYIIAGAAQLGVPSVVLIRMALNIAIESIVGVVPVLGDVFDFAWKANRRNVDLLNHYMEKPGSATASSRLVVFTVIALLVLLLVALGVIAYWILGAVLQAIRN
jgi:hypothetical protein